MLFPVEIMPCSKDYPNRHRYSHAQASNQKLIPSLIPLEADTSYYWEDIRNTAGSIFKITYSQCRDFPSFGI